MLEEPGKENKFKSTLRIQEGVSQPDQVNVSAVHRLKRVRKPQPDAGQYVEGILKGHRTILSQAITLVESALPAHQELAQEVIRQCLPYSGNSLRLGITGVPGVGKSTFIEAFGSYLTTTGHKVAVLAIDPSSQRSKGSILGDKTRMAELSNNPDAFIRPSPTAGTLGGVARKTQESLFLCEAAGFDIIIIETVGVGQSETSVHSMVDFFLLLMLPGAGDELQGIKRGIMEMADAILINKSDGEQKEAARVAQTQYQSALYLFPPSPSGWTPVVETCSAITREGIGKAWEIILDYKEITQKNGFFIAKRREQSRNTMITYIEEALLQNFYKVPAIQKLLKEMQQDLSENRISAYAAAQILMDAYLDKGK